MDAELEKSNENELAFYRKDGCELESLWTEEKVLPEDVKKCVTNKGGLKHPSKIVNGRARGGSAGGRTSSDTSSSFSTTAGDLEEIIETLPSSAASVSGGTAEVAAALPAAETAADPSAFPENGKNKVLLIILDMLSFREVLRSLPKTMLYLSKKLNATVFDNFNYGLWTSSSKSIHDIGSAGKPDRREEEGVRQSNNGKS
eukprot:g16091.t1